MERENRRRKRRRQEEMREDRRREDREGIFEMREGRKMTRLRMWQRLLAF